MIKKLISRLLGKSEGAGAGVPRGKRVEVPKSEHGIDPSQVSGTGHGGQADRPSRWVMARRAWRA